MAGKMVVLTSQKALSTSHKIFFSPKSVKKTRQFFHEEFLTSGRSNLHTLGEETGN